MRNCQTVFQVAAPLCIPTSSIWGFQFLCTLTNTCSSDFFIRPILVGVEWYHCCFDLHFPAGAYWPYVYLPWKNVCSDPQLLLQLGCLFLIGVIRVLYIVWIQIPYQIHVLQLFSYILWVLFTILMVSLEAQNFLILMMSSLFFLPLFVLLVSYLRIHCQIWDHKGLSLFSSHSDTFIVPFNFCVIMLTEG